ncbi:MAG: GAF domain-containing protein, partial [Chloroflexi bacterium]|nr:GAF domain-containing protein [Chloroflexota bacterium]
MAVLLELGQAVCSELDLDAVLRRTAEAARTLLEAQGGSVWQWDEARQELYVAAAVGLGVAAVVGTRMKMGEAVVGKVVAEKKTIHIQDVLTDPVFGRAAGRVRESGIRALVNTPLLYRDEVLGVMGVYWESQREISQREIDLAQMLANYAAIAIRNARTYEEVAASRRRLAAHSRELEVLNR